MKKKSERLTLTMDDVWGMTSRAAPVGERGKDKTKAMTAGMSGGKGMSVNKKAKMNKSPRVSQQEGQ